MGKTVNYTFMGHEDFINIAMQHSDTGLHCCPEMKPLKLKLLVRCRILSIDPILTGHPLSINGGGYTFSNFMKWLTCCLDLLSPHHVCLLRELSFNTRTAYLSVK